MLKSKPTAYSKVIMASVMMPEQANPAGNVHGGEIMKLMDTTAAVVARKHTRSNVVTARVDELEFLQPVFIGNVVTCYGQLIFTGKTSMEISVTVTVEDVSVEGPAKTALTAFFTFVSLNAAGKPQPVPVLELLTEEEHRLFAQGRERYLAHKQAPAKKAGAASWHNDGKEGCP